MPRCTPSSWPITRLSACLTTCSSTVSERMATRMRSHTKTIACRAGGPTLIPRRRLPPIPSRPASARSRKARREDDLQVNVTQRTHWRSAQRLERKDRGHRSGTAYIGLYRLRRASDIHIQLDQTRLCVLYSDQKGARG